jgi:uncharacterized protein
MLEITKYIAQQISIRLAQVEATIALLDDKNTIPFIARYRKEATGGLDEQQLREVEKWLSKLRSLEERRTALLKYIEEQGKLSGELRLELENAESVTALEDLYQPYKPKRRTRASIAREKGLQELAELIIRQPITNNSLAGIAEPFLNDEVPSSDDAWSGARDIVAELISDHPEVRQIVRANARRWGFLRSEKVEVSPDERKVYESYYNFEGKVDRLRPHQVLAINRGEKEKILRVHITLAERDWRKAITMVFPSNHLSRLAEQLELAINDAAGRLLLPAIERDVRRELTEQADTHAIGVFASNLRALLFQPPLINQVVMGIDPGFRTGCKFAVIDSTGKLLETGTIYPHPPQRETGKSLEVLGNMVHKHGVTIIAIGNGTASRETEQLVANLIMNEAVGVKYAIVSEAGASVYSASPLARLELPELDVSLRGAVSIARRIQDPLAELVKIEPRSIGVGLYQHDVDQSELSRSLDHVVESVVNLVGVDVSTASPALLTYVSGIGPKLADRIVDFRNQNGIFRSRTALKKIPGFGPKAFEQAAGFLRVLGGENPLDGTAIHPESYPTAEAFICLAGIAWNSPTDEMKAALEEFIQRKSFAQVAQEIHAGIPTLEDIYEQLIRPGRDPRVDAPPPILRSDVLSVDDLRIGMQLTGSVRNVVDFGAFVDIGVKHDGLLHRSRIPEGVKLDVGNIIQVEILSVEVERGRIGLGWAAA